MARRRANEHGAALFSVAIFLVVILGFTAVGIDVARLAHTATEVQTVADVAARAGAKALLDTGGTPGEGIARAKQIGNLNLMNGELAPDANVVVDEGHYNVATGQFEYCTSDTPCAQNGQWGDLSCVPSDDCDRVTAVLATPNTTVDNLFAGVLDWIQSGRLTSAAIGTAHATTRVEKLALAAPSGPGAGCQVPEGCSANDWGCYCDNGVAPCLPITVPSCEFVPPNCNGNGCSLPTNLQVSSSGSDTAGWWTPSGESTSADTVRGYMAQGPCDPPGPDDILPPQNFDGSLNLNNGINASAENHVFGLAECLAGLDEAPENQPQGCEVDANGNIIPGQRGAVFQIPIFESRSADCTANFNQSAPIVGFATIRITAVDKNGPPRTITIDTIQNTSGTSTQLGGGCFGTDCRVTLAR
jgi:hypothetical protein